MIYIATALLPSGEALEATSDNRSEAQQEFSSLLLSNLDPNAHEKLREFLRFAWQEFDSKGTVTTEFLGAEFSITKQESKS